MAEVRDDLTPTDGISKVFLEFDGLDAMVGGGAEIRFRFVLRQGGHESILTTLGISVAGAEDGLPGMMVRAYDKLIGIFRQNLYLADKMRTHYKNESEQHYPKQK